MKDKLFLGEELDVFLQSIERAELSEEQQILLSGFGGDSTIVINHVEGCTININCNGSNCISSCGATNSNCN